MSQVGCRIIEKINRPAVSMIEALRAFPVSNLDDCMNRMAAVGKNVRPVNMKHMAGPAFTVKVPEGDNLMLHKAMDMAAPGDIIVVAAGDYQGRAIFGELMAKYCQSKKIGGIITDGAVRDIEVLRQLEIPVYAGGVSPNGPYKNGPGEINTDISFSGQVVHPGDIIIGDPDGIVVIRPEDAVDLLPEVRGVSSKEAGILQGIEQSASYQRPWVDEKIKELM